MKKTVLSVFGTRPDAIKMAPLVRELEEREGVRSLSCVTGQHREMLDSVLDIFHIRPDYDISVMTCGQSLSDLTARCLEGMDQVLTEVKPDLVLVQGDTTTALSSAMAAYYHQIPIGHVEAGLRTGNKQAPFPEEMNRRWISSVADLHFCPTQSNVENLKRENVQGNIFLTGNTVLDTIRTTVQKDYVFRTPELKALVESGEKIIVVTCHRRENYGEPMEEILGAIRELAQTEPKLQFVFPVHMNPNVHALVHFWLDGIPNVHLVEPLPVDEMHNLLARCSLVLTDSGGLQEEAPALGKPVLVLRNETERPEAILAGTVELVGTQAQQICQRVRALCSDKRLYAQMAHATNPYGDGKASLRIADAIEEYLSTT